jgi:hypothetical protein
MGDYNVGIVEGVRLAGVAVERRLVNLEKEADRLAHEAEAFVAAGAIVRSVLGNSKDELAGGRLAVQYANILEKWLMWAIDGIKGLHDDAVLRCTATMGAKDELTSVVATLKSMHDAETKKANDIGEYEQKRVKTREDLMARPPGAHPGDPLRDYINATEVAET